MEKNTTSLIYRIFAALLSIVLLALSGFAAYQIVTLNVLPSNLLLPVILIIVILNAILILLINFATHAIWTKVISVILVILVGCTMGFGNVYLYETYSTLTSVTGAEKGSIKNTISVITKTDHDEEIQSLKNEKIGVLRNIDSVGTKKCQKKLKKYSFSYKKYDNLQALVKALYEDEGQAIVMNEIYRANVEEMEEYSGFSNETKSIYQAVYYTNNKNDALVVDDITKNPFTIFVSGNDTYGDIDELSRSDVDMIVTVNPTTSTVLMVNIPRDYYVQTSYGYDKLTHTGMYGIEETKQTVENLLGIDINYTFRVNFSSAEDIVDALDGVDIEVPEGMAVERLNADWALEGVHEGWNHLNGARALAYARERHAYVDGDIQRAKNQQQVLEAIIKKAASSKILTNYTKLLKSFKNAFDTNMSTNEITALLQYELQAMPNWKFQNYVLRGTNSSAVCASMAQELSVVMPEDYCVSIARQKIEAVLDGKSANKIKDEYDTGAAGVAEGYIEQENAQAQGSVYYDYSQNYDYGYTDQEQQYEEPSVNEEPLPEDGE
mgnify:FL=1